MLSIDKLRAPVLEDFDAVNQLIIQMIQSDVPLIDDLANHIVQSGGKRLRPLLVLLVCRACQYSGQDHIKLAALIEFFHTATLLHDDVIDNSTRRRGRETANTIWGSKASILVGDYLFTQYMQLLIQLDNRQIMTLLTNMATQIGCGEIKQLANKHNATLSIEDYFDVIRSKTSFLFAASTASAAILSEVDSHLIQSMDQFGLHLGNAFQLIDDAMDYCSDAETLGKNIGDDLAEGKATMPLLYALQHGTPEQKNCIQLSLKQGTLTYLSVIQDAIAETKAIDYTYQLAQDEINQALITLEHLPPSSYKNTLSDLTNYVIQRNY